MREDLCAEAIRLARLLAELMPDEPEVIGLLALLLLTEARRAARTAADGSLVLLPDQDRSPWDRALIAEGQALVRACLRRNQPGPYQIQAAINAVHTDAADGRRHRLGPDPRALRPAAGRARRRRSSRSTAPSRSPRSTGPAAALATVDGLDLDAYVPFHATRADFLKKLGHGDERGAAYDRAIELTTNDAERTFLERQRESC